MEILFRGFHADENGSKTIKVNGEVVRGEWVAGDLIQCATGKRYIFPAGSYANESNKIGNDGCLSLVAFEVIPETVGQYTNKDDKQGNKIFLHDACQIERECTCLGGTIKFADGSYYFNESLRDSIVKLSDLKYNLFEIKIIGTIFD